MRAVTAPSTPAALPAASPSALPNGLTGDDLSLLAEVGFLAAVSARPAAAQVIFSGLRLLVPARACPYIGLATVHLATGRADEAVRLLRGEALANSPDSNFDIRMFLGLTLTMAGQAGEARRVLERVAAGAPEGSSARATALEALQGQARGPAVLRPVAAPRSADSARARG